MYLYRVYTLFDITCTNVIRHPKITEHNHRETLFQRNQQRNWETMQQVLAMRAQIHVVELPKVIDSCQLFPKKLFKKTRAWTFDFGVEHVDVYGVDLRLLLDDCNGTPMILNLTETAAISTAHLECRGTLRNTFIEFLSDAA